jgi:hypothetical protein
VCYGLFALLEKLAQKVTNTPRSAAGIREEEMPKKGKVKADKGKSPVKHRGESVIKRTRKVACPRLKG